jgi:biotin synthase-like enzyme
VQCYKTLSHLKFCYLARKNSSKFSLEHSEWSEEILTEAKKKKKGSGVACIRGQNWMSINFFSFEKTEKIPNG